MDQFYLNCKKLTITLDALLFIVSALTSQRTKSPSTHKKGGFRPQGLL
jgi:hypothetical protein